MRITSGNPSSSVPDCQRFDLFPTRVWSFKQLHNGRCTRFFHHGKTGGELFIPRILSLHRPLFCHFICAPGWQLVLRRRSSLGQFLVCRRLHGSISREKFFNVSWVDELKMKLSYGRVGNDAVGSYPYQGGYV